MDIVEYMDGIVHYMGIVQYMDGIVQYMSIVQYIISLKQAIARFITPLVKDMIVFKAI